MQGFLLTVCTSCINVFRCFLEFWWPGWKRWNRCIEWHFDLGFHTWKAIETQEGCKGRWCQNERNQYPAILEYFSWHPFLSHYLLTHPIASKDLIWLFKTRPACNVMNMGGRSKLQEKLANVVGPIGRALSWFCPNNTIKASMLGAADWRMAFQHQENDFNGAHTGIECFKQMMFNWHWMF